MKVFVNGLQSLLVHMRVDLGGANVGMAQKFLNDAKVGSILEQMSCKGMP